MNMQPQGDWIVRVSRRDIERFYFLDKSYNVNARRSSAVRMDKETATQLAKAITTHHKTYKAKALKWDSKN